RRWATTRGPGRSCWTAPPPCWAWWPPGDSPCTWAAATRWPRRTGPTPTWPPAPPWASCCWSRARRPGGSGPGGLPVRSAPAVSRLAVPLAGQAGRSRRRLGLGLGLRHRLGRAVGGQVGGVQRLGAGAAARGELRGRPLRLVAVRFLPLGALSVGGGRERPAEVVDRLGELAGDDPEGVALALGERGQRLQVLVGQQLGVGVGGVHRLEHPLDGLGLAVGVQDRGLLLGLRLQDGLLSGALGGEDAGLPLPLGVQDRGPLVAFGPHLLLHRLLDGGRRVDGLDLDAVDADAPLAGGLGEDAAQARVELLARGEGALQVHSADDVAQRGDGELVDGLQVVGLPEGG